MIRRYSSSYDNDNSNNSNNDKRIDTKIIKRNWSTCTNTAPTATTGCTTTTTTPTSSTTTGSGSSSTSTSSSSSSICNNHSTMTTTTTTAATGDGGLPNEYYPLKRYGCNVSETIASKIGKNLHLQKNHPIYLIQNRIIQYFNNNHNHNNDDKNKNNDDKNKTINPIRPKMNVFNDLSPIVTTEQNFDSLRIPRNHPSRSMSDTYYLNYDDRIVLRTHTSAHQVELLRRGWNHFLICGDVYRRDEIDNTHYPIFHQMEGISIFDFTNATTTIKVDDDHEEEENDNDLNNRRIKEIEIDLKQQLEGLVQYLFGSDIQMRWMDVYFPFTIPSYELEIYYNNEWLEVLGCGVIHPDIITNAERNPDYEMGWAFGLGLERLAMILYNIPDIRLFWSTDHRFMNQFNNNSVDDDDNIHKRITFQPYSKYPPCYKDISFWLPNNNNQDDDDTNNSNNNNNNNNNNNITSTLPNETTTSTTSTGGTAINTDTKTTSDGKSVVVSSSSSSLFHINDFNEIVRDIAGDLVEQLQLIDTYVHPKTKRISHCYRITYRSMDRVLYNEEIDLLQQSIRTAVVQQFNVELR